jgi:antitoxin component YwqK of YwqJK toxin-antitoxin module
MKLKYLQIPSLIFLSSVLLILTSCGKEEFPKSSLVLKDNLLYKRGSDVPFTGKEKAKVENQFIEYDVKDGYKHGNFILYFENGNIAMKGQLDSNRNVGKWSYYFPDGKLESEGRFNFDLPDGKWIWNFPDGKKKEEGEYKNGIRIGTWYRYDDKGNVTFEYNYELTDSVTNDSKLQEPGK